LARLARIKAALRCRARPLPPARLSAAFFFQHRRAFSALSMVDGNCFFYFANRYFGPEKIDVTKVRWVEFLSGGAG